MQEIILPQIQPNMENRQRIKRRKKQNNIKTIFINHINGLDSFIFVNKCVFAYTLFILILVSVDIEKQVRKKRAQIEHYG